MNRSLSRGKPGAIARIAILALACGWLSAGPAVAAEPAAARAEASAAAGKRFGVVWRIRGEVAADPGSAGIARQLRAGDPVYVGEHVRAAKSGEAVLKADDAGIVAVRPGAEFVTERFAADGKATDHQTLRLIIGSLRIISGWIGSVNRPENRIVTPQATIGIRGTDHEPYVMSAELAAATNYQQGTYDKVNRGGTTMGAGGQDLAISAGKVGFARAATPGVNTRGLMTILLPVLLDKVPGFYVPGQFDAELDRYSKRADALSRQELQKKRKAAAGGPAAAAGPATVPAIATAPAAATAPATATAPAVATAPTAGCAPDAIAKAWLAHFDGGIARGDAAVIMSMFAPEVVVRANVRGADGTMYSVDLAREELATSTVASVKRLTNFQQRRVSVEATQEASGSAACDRVRVRSVSIEQGKQAGKPYRFESLEEFLLEKRSGIWLAVKAETTQR